MLSSKQLHPHASHMHRFSLAHVKPLSALGANRLTHFAAASVLSLFFPIFLYEFFGLSLTAVLVWYAIDFTVKIPMIVIASRLFNKIGLKWGMVIGTLGAIVFNVAGYALDQQLAHPYMWLGVAIFGLMILTSFYWSPFHTDFARFSKKGHRGREISFLMSAERLLSLASPVVGAWLITHFSYQANFLVATVFLVISMIPVLLLPKAPVKYEFGFIETFKRLFDKRWRHVSVSMMSFGGQNAVEIVIWPIFLFTVFKGEYLDIGAFAAIIVVVTLFVQYLVGKFTDRKKATQLLEMGTGLYACGWMAKAMVSSVGGVFAATTFHSLGNTLFRIPMDATMYEQAADAGHYIDEYTTIRELSLTIGRAAMFIALIAITYFFSLQAAFVTAALLSLGMTQLIKHVHG